MATPSEDPGKEAFLQRVRQALGRSAPLIHVPDLPSLKASLVQQEQKVRTIQARIEARLPRLLTRLVERAERGGWQVHRVSTHEDAARTVAEVARACGARRAVRSSQDIFQRVDVDTPLKRAGVTPLVLAVGRGRRRDALRPLALEADIGISGVDYAIAETGSCVVVPRKGLSRLVSLTPPVYVALVEPERVVESLDDVLALRRLEYLRIRRGPVSTYMNFISGPSRTGDIEQTITIGVHGPGEVHLVLMG